MTPGDADLVAMGEADRKDAEADHRPGHFDRDATVVAVLHRHHVAVVESHQEAEPHDQADYQEAA